MARTAKEDSSQLPSPGDPDRKRVLNVLAQRRYRQRKREKLANLEAQASNSSVSRTTDSPSDDEAQSPRESDDIDRTRQRAPDPFSSMLSAAGPANETIIEPVSDGGVSVSLESDTLFSTPDLAMTDLSQSNFALNETATTLNFFSNSIAAPQDQHDPFEHFNAVMQSQSPPHYIDSALDLPEMKILRVSMSIAQLLGCADTILDITARWTLDPQSAALLPANYQPTEAQMRIPHHPMFDLFPWPSMRTKLIGVFALPPELRPRNARNPEAMIQLVTDLEDQKDPFRVEGPNGTSEKDWEIGEAFFRGWWWVVDRDMLENTNKLRQKRGAPRLRLEGAP